MLSRRHVVVGGMSVALAARADTYPSRTVTLIAPFAPGASADGIARLVGEGIASRLGKPVIVDNRPGGGGSIGLIAVARSAPDGYTLGVGATGAMTVSPHVPGSSAGFDPLRELTPIAKLVDIPLVLVASPKSGLRTLADVVAASKATPGGLNFGSTGLNSSQHLAIEVLKRQTGAKLVHVAYRGSAPAVTDVLGGQVPLASVDLTPSIEHIRSGGLVPIGVLSLKRVSFASEIPTIAESGVPGFEISAWIGFFGPAGLPTDLTARLSAEAKTSLEQPGAQLKLQQLACVPAYSDPQTFRRYLGEESEKMRDLVASLGSGQ